MPTGSYVGSISVVAKRPIRPSLVVVRENDWVFIYDHLRLRKVVRDCSELCNLVLQSCEVVLDRVLTVLRPMSDFTQPLGQELEAGVEIAHNNVEVGVVNQLIVLERLNVAAIIDKLGCDVSRHDRRALPAQVETGRVIRSRISTDVVWLNLSSLDRVECTL